MSNDARDGRGAGSPADRDLSARLGRLGTKLHAKRNGAPEPGERSEASPSGPSDLGRAFRLSTEFVAGIIAGGGIGWVFDRALGTSPWGLIVFLMLGFAAGTFNVVRSSGSMGRSGADGGAGSKPRGR
jgi:ATP synthase protein I